MPSNIEAEQAVLGSLLLSKEKYPEVDALINPGDFESQTHREIYECIKQLADQGKGIDHITVSKQLDRNNSSVNVDYLKELQTCLLYTSPSPRDRTRSRMPSSA